MDTPLGLGCHFIKERTLIGEHFAFLIYVPPIGANVKGKNLLSLACKSKFCSKD